MPDDQPDIVYAPAGDTDDEGMGETLTVGELKKRLNVQDVQKAIDAENEDEIMGIMAVLGADPKSFRREKKQAVRRIVSEIYSPPRVTAMLKRLNDHGLIPGLALDLTTMDPDDGTPWDFDLPAKREKALKLLRAQKPLFVIGSPMCTRWCSWQRLNDLKRNAAIVQHEKDLALTHLEFMAQIYWEQIQGERFFLHEHPEAAGSWEESCIQDLLEHRDVERVVADQCQYGQEVQYGEYKGQPVRKSTGFMSNAPRLLAQLQRRCGTTDGQCSRRGGGQHAVASGRVAKDAARYSDGLCRAIIKGMTDEMQWRGIWRRGEVGLHAVTDEDPVALPAPGCRCAT